MLQMKEDPPSKVTNVAMATAGEEMGIISSCTILLQMSYKLKLWHKSKILVSRTRTRQTRVVNKLTRKTAAAKALQAPSKRETKRRKKLQDRVRKASRKSRAISRRRL